MRLGAGTGTKKVLGGVERGWKLGTIDVSIKENGIVWGPGKDSLAEGREGKE